MTPERHFAVLCLDRVFQYCLPCNMKILVSQVKQRGLVNGAVYCDFGLNAKGSIIPALQNELQNRVMHYDGTNRVTNFNLFFFYFFELVTRCEKSFNIILELITRNF